MTQANNKEESNRVLFKNMVPINEIAAHVPYTPKTVRNWRAKGLYPWIFIKFGGRVFIDLNEIQKIIDEQKMKARKDAKRFDLN